MNCNKGKPTPTLCHLTDGAAYLWVAPKNEPRGCAKMPQKEGFITRWAAWLRRDLGLGGYSLSVKAGDAIFSPCPGVARRLALLFVVLVCLTPLPAQLQEQADVHIQPRHLPEEAKPSIADPALKTHTKPIIRDVDVVLVPVTVKLDGLDCVN